MLKDAGRRFRPEQVKHASVHALLNITGESTYKEVSVLPSLAVLSRASRHLGALRAEAD
jgi:hypothetical protein